MDRKGFVNPYNFIPLSEIAPERSGVKKGEFTGVIRYTLRTRTPLIIPNTSNEHAFDVRDKDGNPAHTDHKSFDFFSYDDISKDAAADNRFLNEQGFRDGLYSEPVIPGSEVRGMLRSYYEILTNSCMSFVDDEEPLSKRTGEVFTPGLIERKADGTFVLHKAEDCLLRMKNTDELDNYSADENADLRIKSYKTKALKEGQKVCVGIVERGNRIKPVVDEISLTDDGRSAIGYVLKGEDGPKMGKNEKHNCHVFIENGVERVLKDLEISTLSTVLKIYKNNGTSEYNEYRYAWNSFKRGEGEEFFPVYYSRFNAKADFMLSPASITREVYTVQLRKILREHCSCTNSGEVCPACALFGMLGKTSNVTSRVRVADLKLSEKDAKIFGDDEAALFEGNVTLAPLNTPKINNIEFYVKRPTNDAWFWTYDYYIDNKGTAHAYVPEINGRKFYWHQPEMKMVSTEPDNLNSTVRPLREGVEFTGEIYFDHINGKELRELIYAIDAGDADPVESKRHCYKLGHGKPLGYGSIALHVDAVELREITLDEEAGTIRYAMKEVTMEPALLDAGIVHNFDIMTDFELLRGKEVHYPKPTEPDNEGNYPIFGWFVKNHGGYRHDKKVTMGMPNKRTRMTYIEHMYALEPELRPTGAPAPKKENRSGKPQKPTGNNSIEVEVLKVRDDGGIDFKVEGRYKFITGKFMRGKNFKAGDKVKVRPKTITTKKGDSIVIYELVV